MEVRTDFQERINHELETEIQPKVFLTEVFWKSLRVVDVRGFGSWVSAPKC